MSRIEPEREEYIILPMFAHEGPMSLDAIATEVYGKTYCGQQTGEMIGNDSHMTYDFSTKESLDWYVSRAENEIQVWLDLKIGDRNPGYYERGEIITSDTEIERAAPAPSYILADLILKGHLPMGKYLMSVWW